MNKVTDLIIHGKDENSVFVFPSEAAAVNRRKEFLKVTGIKAVKNSRFISWDRFKEQITSHERTEKPVNSTLRRLFASDVIRRNSEDPIFTRLVPLEYRSRARAFADSVYRILPELELLVRKISETPEVFDPGLGADYQKLYHDYRNFMIANGLFEPSWEEPELHELSLKYFIICPEIIEDFNEWERLLKDAGCRIISRIETSTGKLKLYENSVIETDMVLNQISELISRGVRHTEIAVTSADENAAQLLLSKARLRGIALNYRSGKPLSDYPAGRLPELIRSCLNSSFSSSSMKNLLLYRAFVWKNAETAASLIRFGIEHRCLKNTSSRPSGDVWAKRLKSISRQDYAKRDIMLNFYRKLRAGIEKIAQSTSFRDLSNAFQIFVSTFLVTETETWNTECEKVFQRTREILSELCETEIRLENIEITDPLGLWIELLNEKIYVQQNTETGISMFPYRVSALINPAYHFVIGLSHDSSAAVSSVFSFLTDQQRRDIGALELNMTEDFLRIYTLSGRDVRFSSSAMTTGGAALPPGLFIEDGTIERIRSSEMDSEFFKDPVQAENLWWDKACSSGLKTGEAGRLPRLTERQLSGFSYASATFMTDRGFDASRQQFSADIVEMQLIPSLSDEECGSFRVSATSLNRWTDCRFNMLLTDALGIYEDEYILRAEDPWTAGSVMHDILFEFFSKIKDSGSVFRLSGNSEAYRKLLSDSASMVFSDWENSGNYFYGPAWDSLKRKALQDLLLFPEAEAALFEGLLPELLEEWLEFTITEKNIRVFGKLDRISVGDKGAVIVDYKKTWKKQSREKFITEDENGELLPPKIGYQLPFYILLAEHNGMQVDASTYYSISSAAHFPVSGDYGVLDADDVRGLCSLTLVEIERMAAECRRGDFSVPQRCDGCSFRAVCRKRFNVRWTN